MSNLAYFENIIKEKRKKTDFRDFVKNFGSWYPIIFYRNNKLISKYPETNRLDVISLDEYNKQRDDFCVYGMNFDEKKSFFSQLINLFRTVPHSNIYHIGNNENCDYCETAVLTKNAYLSFVVSFSSENVFYSNVVRENCKNVFNSCYVQHGSENIYTCLGIEKSFKIFYSRFINNSNNIWFSTNLIGCSECIFCNSLENKKYCINNKQLEKEEYFEKKKHILSQKEKFLSFFIDLSKVHGNNYNSINVNGSFITNSENIENSFGTIGLKNARNVLISSGEQSENIYDAIMCGKLGNNIIGVANCGGGSENLFLCNSTGFSSNIYYSIGMDSCSFCLGCIGLKNKSFCILNKQYTKEEWYNEAEKIFAQMERDGTLGEFFPGELNPFYFNDTMAYLIDDSFTKEEVERKGYMWREEEIKVDIPENAEVVYTVETKDFLSLQDYQGFDSNGNWIINPDILKKVIKDEKGNVYKIVPMEYEFLMKHGLPLPEIHWLDRIKLGFKF